ncbi:MAG TPA: hypothetical protein VFN76_09745 [Candidatus Limnocylindria bacterium]|nr:hypothetical protein [Candidatus Limnocylindria bacterium]
MATTDTPAVVALEHDEFVVLLDRYAKVEYESGRVAATGRSEYTAIAGAMSSRRAVREYVAKLQGELAQARNAERVNAPVVATLRSQVAALRDALDTRGDQLDALRGACASVARRAGIEVALADEDRALALIEDRLAALAADLRAERQLREGIETERASLRDDLRGALSVIDALRSLEEDDRIAYVSRSTDLAAPLGHVWVCVLKDGTPTKAATRYHAPTVVLLASLVAEHLTTTSTAPSRAGAA